MAEDKPALQTLHLYF